MRSARWLAAHGCIRLRAAAGSRRGCRAAARRVRVLPERLVIQVRREPPLDLLDGHPLAGGVGGDLAATDLADGEVARIGVGEVEPANGVRRVHGEGLGQSAAGRALGLVQYEQGPILSVIESVELSRDGEFA